LSERKIPIDNINRQEGQTVFDNWAKKSDKKEY
jgi:hypothetical protein